jgi:hypothetical protein
MVGSSPEFERRARLARCSATLVVRIVRVVLSGRDPLADLPSDRP